MPDLLTHYAASYLVASRVTDRRRAALLALAGLLPDADALLRIHRSATHSLLLTALACAALAALLALVNRTLLKHLALIVGLYALHLAMDLLNAPTPILWPLTDQAYQLKVEVACLITESGAEVIPRVSLESEPADFAQHQALEGPLATETGAIIALAVAAALAAERVAGRRRAA